MSGVELSPDEASSLSQFLRRTGHLDNVLKGLAARLPGPAGRDWLFPPVYEAYSAHGTGPGTMEITIGREAGIILTYERNYHSFGTTTFAPFKVGERWMALASRDYTCTELLDITTGVWVGGEKPDALGFCPVQLFVPRWRAFRLTDRQSDEVRYVTECESDARLRFLERRVSRGEIEWVGEGHAKIGFVAGCIWGDDGSWKVEAFDLRRADEGFIHRVAPWGYVELPDWACDLRDAIRFDADWTPDDTRCNLATLTQADAVVAAHESDDELAAR